MKCQGPLFPIHNSSSAEQSQLPAYSAHATIHPRNLPLPERCSPHRAISQSYFSLLCAIAITFATTLLRAQTTPPSAPAPATDNQTVQPFGANADLEGNNVDKSTTVGAATAGQSPAAPHHGEFAFSPIPMVNPSIGNGGGGAVIYARRLDSGSPASSFSAAGFGTGRGSWGFGLGARVYLSNDRYRILAGGGGGEFNYNFFGVGADAGAAGISIPLSQRSRGFLVEPKMRVWRRWYVGPRYHLITNHISLGTHHFDLDDLPIPLPSDLRFQTAALGARVQRDTSDSPFYPRHGSLVDLTADFFAPAFGADRSYRNLTVSYDKYLSVGAKNVFAVHASLCTVTDKAPFFDVCELGQSKDLRGYQRGQFRDDRMLVGQAEYRRDLIWRLGMVAFAGAGAVGSEFDKMGDAEPGGGLGLRFVIAKRNHINLRADYAWGDNSRATYISLGEAF
jgi:hypothetical protein